MEDEKTAGAQESGEEEEEVVPTGRRGAQAQRHQRGCHLQSGGRAVGLQQEKNGDESECGDILTVGRRISKEGECWQETCKRPLKPDEGGERGNSRGGGREGSM